jgi:hypothetical protein
VELDEGDAAMIRRPIVSLCIAFSIIAAILISLVIIADVTIGTYRLYRYIAPEHAVKVKP